LQLTEHTQPPVPSMTSLQIAEVVEKRHDNVKRTIETLANQGVIARPQIEDVLKASDKRARTYTEKAYRFSGAQGRRDSTIVVAQMSPQHTAALVDRWMELEKQAALAAFNLPQTHAEALRLAADLAEERARLQAELAQAAPKVEAYNHLVEDDTLYRTYEAAKHLAAKPRKFVTWLLNNGWAYRHGADGRLLAHQDKLDKGWLAHKINKFWNWNLLMNDTSANLRITSKGLTELRKHVPAGVFA